MASFTLSAARYDLSAADVSSGVRSQFSARSLGDLGIVAQPKIVISARAPAVGAPAILDDLPVPGKLFGTKKKCTLTVLGLAGDKDIYAAWNSYTWQVEIEEYTGTKKILKIGWARPFDKGTANPAGPAQEFTIEPVPSAGAEPVFPQEWIDQMDAGENAFVGHIVDPFNMIVFQVYFKITC